ncbi:hypothetical protein HYPSUDRAFT_398012 [Hypholoma sublateritium FD-334 SS-4]|uniref:Uncharacterized protein n=1 Tax=Hypholoma sublateritium (strain FD-334 SS-4) TaxID=945553 RepID=A0A0D2N7Q1_HYPSF|nr:hypothetical protein HYPSUDRAFT_398012 [Hypholoma sublateritium FD-334 SS-4]
MRRTLIIQAHAPRVHREKATHGRESARCMCVHHSARPPGASRTRNSPGRHRAECVARNARSVCLLTAR